MYFNTIIISLMLLVLSPNPAFSSSSELLEGPAKKKLKTISIKDLHKEYYDLESKVKSYRKNELFSQDILDAFFLDLKQIKELLNNYRDRSKKRFVKDTYKLLYFAVEEYIEAIFSLQIDDSKVLEIIINQQLEKLRDAFILDAPVDYFYYSVFANIQFIDYAYFLSKKKITNIDKQAIYLQLKNYLRQLNFFQSQSKISKNDSSNIKNMIQSLSTKFSLARPLPQVKNSVPLLRVVYLENPETNPHVGKFTYDSPTRFRYIPSRLDRLGSEHSILVERHTSVRRDLAYELETLDIALTTFPESQKEVIKERLSQLEKSFQGKSRLSGNLFNMDSDPECPVSLGTYTSVLNTQMLIEREVQFHSQQPGSRSFLITRPPGHHSDHDCCMGFCYFNNIVFAARRALQLNPGKQALIIDIDLHWGNGTDSDFQSWQNTVVLNLYSQNAFPFLLLQCKII